MPAQRIKPHLRRRVIRRDGGRCLVCGLAHDLTIDHIRPWSLYPKSRRDINNLQTLCVYCNRIKGLRIADLRNGIYPA